MLHSPFNKPESAKSTPQDSFSIYYLEAPIAWHSA